MGQAIPLRKDYTADQLRRLARQTKDVSQARRLLAIAAVLDGASRAEAARIGGMDRQTLRDWVIRFNALGPEGLINIRSPGVPPKLAAEHRSFLGRMVEEGPLPAVHGVVRWRACDLIALLQEEFGISVSDDTIYRTLKDLGFCPSERAAEGLSAGSSSHGGAQKRMARPVCKMNLKMVVKACAKVSGLTSIARSQDGDPRVLVLIKVSASKRRFLNQADRTPVDR